MTRVVSLRDVVEWPTGTCNPRTKPNEPFNYIDVAAVDNQHKIVNNARIVSGHEAPSRARKILEANDVLVSTVRPNLNAVALVPPAMAGAIGSTGFCVLRALAGEVLPEYLFFFVRSRRFVETLSSLVAGALYPAVTDSQVLDQRLPLPAIGEQRQMVELLTRADGIVTLRRKAQKTAQAIIPALFLDMFGEPAANAKGWSSVPLGAHVIIPSSVRTPDLVIDADRLCIGADSIESKTGAFLACSTVREVMPKSGKYWFQRDDVLYSKIRPYLAKAALASSDGFCSADMYPLRCRATLQPRFLLSLLLSKAFTDFASAESVRAQMPKLNREALFGYAFLLPDSHSQMKFAKVAEYAQSVGDHQIKATAKAEATFNALLGQAFQ